MPESFTCPGRGHRFDCPFSTMDTVVDILADRYASPAMKALWSPRGRVLLERDYWIAVMKAQQSLGLPIPAEAIAAYERVRDHVNLESIKERERVTRHDVKARIDEFCAIAGHEQIHKGLTSRDLTENVEQLQVFRSLQILRLKSAAALDRLGKLATRHRDLVLTARTHNVAAQPTTWGKRIAMFGEDLLRAHERLEQLIATYPVRGLKGPVGTQVDLLTLFAGDEAKVATLESKILGHLGISRAWQAVGQVYPRSLDMETVGVFCQLASGPGSFAKTLRLMAGHELASEGFAKGQTGSSAMPHKMNSRSCERINGFGVILRGYLSMASELAGDQWNEGDVSCSVVRRVVLPDACFAMDGLFETFITVLDQIETFPDVISRENRYYLPFLATTTILMEAVKAGAGREHAHEAIKENAVATVLDLRNGRVRENDLLKRLAADTRLGLPISKLEAIIAEAERLTGLAARQVDQFAATTGKLAAATPGATAYKPGAIL